jgi:hypothetical protein
MMFSSRVIELLLAQPQKGRSSLQSLGLAFLIYHMEIHGETVTLHKLTIKTRTSRRSMTSCLEALRECGFVELQTRSNSPLAGRSTHVSISAALLRDLENPRPDRV